jgi:hypothetical protein
VFWELSSLVAVSLSTLLSLFACHYNHTAHNIQQHEHG